LKCTTSSLKWYHGRAAILQIQLKGGHQTARGWLCFYMRWTTRLTDKGRILNAPNCVYWAFMISAFPCCREHEAQLYLDTKLAYGCDRGSPRLHEECLRAGSPCSTGLHSEGYEATDPESKLMVVFFVLLLLTEGCSHTRRQRLEGCACLRHVDHNIEHLLSDCASGKQLKVACLHQASTATVTFPTSGSLPCLA
jgi:hypothetical protein